MLAFTTVHDAISEAPGWWRALTLKERLLPLPVDVQASDRARRRLERWRQQYRCDTDRVWARHAAHNAPADTLLALLDEPDAVLKSRTTTAPWWRDQWSAALAGLEAEPPSVMTRPSASPFQAFINLFVPLVTAARTDLRDVLRRHEVEGAVPVGFGRLDELLFPGLASSLLEISARTLVLEMNVARMEGVLEGATSEERFTHFSRRLRVPEIAGRLLAEYPVLARDAASAVNRWTSIVQEFADRLAADWTSICQQFGLRRDSRIESIAQTGDRHGGGRAVLIVTFEDQSRLVYNPRSVQALARFQDLLSWCNEQNVTPPFRRLQVYERPGYGWIEFVQRADCRSPDEARRFYERQGAYLAMLYAFGANDFHYENLIAAGEHPVLVDLETILVPTEHAPELRSATELVYRQLTESVLRVGLLPQHAWATDNHDGVDLSGLGGRAGQQVPFPRLEWENQWTDQMRGVHRQGTLAGASNLPRLDGVDLSAVDYVPSLLTGFESMYRLWVTRRDDLLAAGGPLAAFANADIRVILRPTAFYGALIKQANHPDLQRDALDREPLFDLLASSSAGRPRVEDVIPWEIDDLLAGDVPLFCTTGGSRDLHAPGGRTLPDFLAESGLDAAARRVRALNEDDLVKQIWTIEAAFAAYRGTQLPAREHGMQPAPAIAQTPALIAAASAIADRLTMLAVRVGDEAGWMGLVPVADKRWRVGPVGGDIYSGAGGIALFLAYLARVSRDDRHLALARAALRTAEASTTLPEGVSDAPGAFSGIGYLVYVLTHLGKLWKDDQLLDRAEVLCDRVLTATRQSPQIDFLSGCAGIAALLSALHAVRPCRETRNAVQECADLTVTRAKPMPEGCAWESPSIVSAAPLTGFSHGAAGIGSALLTAAGVTGETRFVEAARAAIQYERSTFSAEMQNWPDYRLFGMTTTPPDYVPAYVAAWCHGAPGIGLARVRALGALDDPLLPSEIQTAIATTERAFGANHCLCHGDLGNLELLREAAARDLYDVELVKRYESAILASLSQDGWRCGAATCVETPGLMVGLAGIGFGLLRAAAPDAVPNILVLDAPIE